MKVGVREGAALIIALALAACGDAAPRKSDEASARIAGRPHAASAGEAVYLRWCAACHDPGLNHAGTLALQTKYAGKVPAVLKERKDLSVETVGYFVRNGVSIMPIFRKTEISDQELKELSAFLSAKK